MKRNILIIKLILTFFSKEEIKESREKNLKIRAETNILDSRKQTRIKIKYIS
jgi:hypothetical protein